MQYGNYDILGAGYYTNITEIIRNYRYVDETVIDRFALCLYTVVGQRKRGGCYGWGEMWDPSIS